MNYLCQLIINKYLCLHFFGLYFKVDMETTGLQVSFDEEDSGDGGSSFTYSGEVKPRKG